MLDLCQNGFARVERHGMTALVCELHADAVAGALLERTGCTVCPSAGRGDLYRFVLPDGEGVVRPYLRGGLMRFFLREGYLFGNRPLAELTVHLQCYRQGLPVPEPLGACWERKRGVLTGAFATRLVRGIHLGELCARVSSPPTDVLKRVGCVIRAFHEAGIYHADLQVRNLLVADDRVVVLDFDNAYATSRLSDTQRVRNLLRLRRSFAKNGLPLAWFDLVRDGYGPMALTGWDAAYRLKGWISDTAARRNRRDV